MKNARGVRLFAPVVAAIAVAVGLTAGQSATAARSTGPAATPQTYLVTLEEAPTLRVFRQNWNDGLRTARSAAREQKQEIGQAQNEVISELPADAGVIYRTHSVLAAVGVDATAGDQAALEQIEGVKAVYPVASKRPSNSFAAPLQAAPQAWQSAGVTGQGMKIAVVDSGLDYTHSDFGGPGTPAAWAEAHANEAEDPDPDFFDEDKFLGGYDLVGDDYNTDRSDPNYQPVPHPDQNPLDCGGHGSHVAGSAAGYGVNADGSTYTGSYDESTDFGAMKIGPGIAPEAGIIAIRVFGCHGSSNVVTQAIDRAADPNGDGDPSDRADVINLSLGSDFGSVDDGDSQAVRAAVNLGISVVAAAGNAGDQADITGSPGDASQVLSVASSVDAGAVIDGVDLTIDGNPEGFGMSRSALYDWDANPDLSGEVVLAPPENDTACAPYTGTPFTGKVVLVKWTASAIECGSVQRANNLEAAGATGFIFGNDEEALSVGINGNAGIPGVLVVDSGRVAIRTAIADGKTVMVSGTGVNSIVQDFPELVDRVSDFTSRGIHATGNVKPDVAAVGNTVFSAAVGRATEGTTMSGTSMASPMVAGLAALVRQVNPGWSPLQVKADIMNTAGHDLFVNGSVDPGSGTYGPPRVGAGRIDAESAVGNKVLAYNPTGGSVSVSFGPVEAGGPVSLSREVTVDNQSASPVTYGIEYDPINEVPGAEFTVSPAEVTLDPGETTTVTVGLEIEDPAELTKAVDPTVGRFASTGAPRETLAEAFGRLLLEPVGPGATLRVPVYASPRPASAMTQPDTLGIHRDAATAGDPVQKASFGLSGDGVGTDDGDNGRGDGDPDNDIQSVAAGFELQATSGQSPQCDLEVTDNCWRLPEEKYADLAMVGYSSDAPLQTDPATGTAYIALAVHGPAAIPANKSYLEVDIDVDGDDSPDLYLFNDRSGEDDLFVATLFDPAKPVGQRVIDQQPINGRYGDFDTALYDSDVMVLPVSLEALADYGVDEDNPRINYGVIGFTYSSNQPIDTIGINLKTELLEDPLSANLYEPGIVVTDSEGQGPLVDDQPGDELTVTRNIASSEADGGAGLMMLHFHNQVGDKAQTVSLRGAESATELIVTPGNLSARVDAVGAGLPVPSGLVNFKVDGTELGSAPVEGGVAVLDHDLAHGATRQVEAIYSGDADFEPSSDQVGRSDPGLTAKITTKGKNRFGWYRKPVTVTFRCTTNGSGLTEDCPYPRRLARDGRGQKVSRSIVAFDGGRASVTVRGINIDRTRPVLRLRGVKRGATYPRVRRAKCAARDRTSGVLRCRVSWGRRGNRVIYRAAATDRAGNRSTLRLRVRVRR